MCCSLFYLFMIYLGISEVHAQDFETHFNVSPTPENNGSPATVIGNKMYGLCTYNCAKGAKKPVVNTNTDVGNGTLIARFPLPPFECNHDKYRVHLMVYEAVEKSKCNENETNFYPGIHSTKEYKIINQYKGRNCKGNNCTEYGELIFNHVFSSCYKLRVKPFNGTSTRPGWQSCPFFISTNASKFRIADFLPTVRVNGGLVAVHFAPNVTFESADISLFGDLKSLEDGSCDRDGKPNLSCSLGKTRKPLCHAFTMHLHHVPVAPVCNYTEPNKTIQCAFDMTPGNYCVKVKLIDDRCADNTTWTVNSTACQWNHPFVRAYHPPNQTVITVPVASAATVFFIFLVVAIGCLLVFLLFWRRAPQNSNWSAELSEEVIRPMIERLKVLLLYPRDCQEFMNVMKSFRKLLETYNIEVYDFHASDEVSKSPLCWVQNVMAYPKLRTVIVSSHCAYLQQQAIQTGCISPAEIIYKDPIFIDSLFIYGLKIIMEDISIDTYLKNYVIRFGGFSSDQKILSLTTSFRRYCIPEHLPKLLMDLNLEKSVENISCTSSNEFMVFQNDLDALARYIETNPHYLEDLINLV